MGTQGLRRWAIVCRPSRPGDAAGGYLFVGGAVSELADGGRSWVGECKAFSLGLVYRTLTGGGVRLLRTCPGYFVAALRAGFHGAR